MIRAVVVDEPPARRCLISLLNRTERVQVVGEAEDAIGGLRLCRDSGAEVAFLDIRLPEGDGLALGAALARLPEPPLFVFVTRHAEYAVTAFEIHAADYLLKPLEAGRVEAAVRHLEQRLYERRSAQRDPDADAADNRLPVRLRDHDLARLLARHEILAILRRGRRSWIHTADAEYPTYYTVSGVENWLGGAPFLRVARDAIVNMGAVAEIIHHGDRLYQLRLMDRPGTVVEVSRRAASALSNLLRPPL